MNSPDGAVPPWSAPLVRALEAIAQGVVIAHWQEPDDPIIYVNPAFERLRLQLTGAVVVLLAVAALAPAA